MEKTITQRQEGETAGVLGIREDEMGREIELQLL